MNIACQLCNNSKVYCKCIDCEIFLCSHCDYKQHLIKKSQSKDQDYEGQEFLDHKRIRICEECEEQECAIQCLNCELFQCMSCNNRFHQKGARQKHIRKTIRGEPEFIVEHKNRPKQDVRDSQFVPKENEKRSESGTYDQIRVGTNKDFANWSKQKAGYGPGTESESSRKDSIENDYMNEDYLNEKDDSYQTYQTIQNVRGGFNERKKPPYIREQYGSGSRQGTTDESSYYLSHGKQGKPANFREGKRGSYSSGGSSGGGGTGSGNYSKGSYQNYKQSNEHYYNQYLGGNKGSGKYRKGNYYQEQYGSSEKLMNAGSGVLSNQEPIPSQYFDVETNGVLIPIFQPYVRCEQQSQEMISLQRELFEFARKGELLIDYELFRETLIKKLKYKDKQCRDLITLAEEQGIIHQTKRNFANMRTLSFVSLQLDMISHECVQWVLSSLKNDEMTPTERAVQSRIKEAFAFKISAQLWDCMMESLLESEKQQQKNENYYQKQGSKNSQSQYKVITVREIPNNSNIETGREKKQQKQTYNDYYSMNKKYQKDQYQSKTQYTYLDRKNQEKEFEFSIKEIEEDPSIGQMTKVIYPKNEEEWIGIDQNTEEINFNQYDELKTFLYNYFCGNQEDLVQEEEKWISSISRNSNAQTGNNQIQSSNTIITQNPTTTLVSQSTHGASGYTGNETEQEEVRAIPGGRYGCAQFVKICGPPSLKQLSLGRLASLVQYAVKEDVLRYHKTLLVWTTTVDKHKKLAEELQKESQKNATVAAKLNVVKDALLDILAESKTGMSLAQLPLYLRRKLDFVLDLNELGFPKLKDLILSMSDKIKLELRGHNHPFAYLVKSGRYQHANSNSDDFQSIPKNKGKIPSNQHQMSVDVNVNRHLNNALALNETKVKTVLTAFLNLMRERPYGVKSDEIGVLLTNKVGFEFNIKDFGCYTLLEFLKKFIIPTLDLEIVSSTSNEEEIFLIRSKQFFMNYNIEQQKQQQQMLSKLTLNEQNQTLSTNATQQNIMLSDQKSLPQLNVSSFNQQFQPQTQLQQQENMKRTDSASSSLNYNYIPNHQSLYGEMGSPNNSQYQLNISHIRFNTSDTNDLNLVNPNVAKNQQQVVQQQLQQQDVSYQYQQPYQQYYQKPPLAPPTMQQIQQQQQHQQQIQQQQQQQQYYISNQQQQQYLYQQRQNQYRTYPPPQQQQQLSTQQQTAIMQQQQILKSQSPVSTMTNQSVQSYSQAQQMPIFSKGQFQLTPSQVFQKVQGTAGVGVASNMTEFQNQSQQQLNQSQSSVIIHNQDSPKSFNRDIVSSLNQSIVGGGTVGAGGVHSTTSKSASQDFSIQSQFHFPSNVTNQIQPSSIFYNPNLANSNSKNTIASQFKQSSGFTTPQVQNYGGFQGGMFQTRGGGNIGTGQRMGMGVGFQNYGGDSIFGSPIPRSYQFETNSLNYQNLYNYEVSPPYDQNDDEGDQQHNINTQFVDKLLCDDDLDYRSNIDEQQSAHSNMHSPDQLFGSVNQTTTALRVPPTNLINNSNNFNMTRQQNKQKTWSVDMMNKQGGGTSSSTVSSGGSFVPSSIGGATLQIPQVNQNIGGGSASKGLLGSSNSQSNISGTIIEGGSSSSEENKRPSTVLEQRTEEDEADSIDDKNYCGGNSAKTRGNLFYGNFTSQTSNQNLGNQPLFQLASDQQQQQLQHNFQQEHQEINSSDQKKDDCLWSNDVNLF